MGGGGGGKKRKSSGGGGPDWAAVMREQQAAQERALVMMLEEQRKAREAEAQARADEDAKRAQELHDTTQRKTDEAARLQRAQELNAGAQQTAGTNTGIGTPTSIFSQAIKASATAPGLDYYGNDLGNKTYSTQTRFGGI